jgi:hypothetical protein
VPVTWQAREWQIERWAVGHTECLHRYLRPLLRSGFLGWKAKLDGALMLGVYLTAPLMVVGWIACAVLFFAGQSFLPTLAAFFLAGAGYNAVGNFASFFEIGSSVILDGAQRRVLLLPLNIANFVFSTVAVTAALAKYYFQRIAGGSSGARWHKTERYRNGNGANGNPLRESQTARLGGLHSYCQEPEIVPVRNAQNNKGKRGLGYLRASTMSESSGTSSGFIPSS